MEIKEEKNLTDKKTVILELVELGKKKGVLSYKEIEDALAEFELDIKDIDYSKIDVYKFMNDYFEELTELARWKYCDALAHITCPMRGIKGVYKIDFDYSKVQQSLDKLLLTMIENNKALEINTSGLRQPIGLTMPEEQIVRRYRELGGEYVTIGSDAHNAYDVGEGIETAMQMLKRCGFNKVTFYVSRQAMQIEI